ncbi:lipid droplet-associated protein [Gordonia sp. (in: high G+C Gram-positive bacteria)]|uniref:lipid droplet-associated protein n=2 Tax=Gordonia sp. (in: high G+C Gram-positive bacteria) TaxID=84139 RepID=UPI00352921CB
MRRPPYPARVAAGVLVTTLDETKRLPTRIITFPMSAVSRGLQMGMRIQQNIAEMAIKGDEFFAPFCDQPEEQPSWARFDDDEAVISLPEPEPAPPTTLAKAAATAPPAAKKTARKPARQAAPAPATTALDAEPPSATAGRFALYSSPPADAAPAPGPDAAAKPAPAADAPAIAETLEYDGLTLAQLRAKLRGLSTDDLEALAAYERAGRNRTPFVTMIDNRIASHQKKSSPSA